MSVTYGMLPAVRLTDDDLQQLHDHVKRVGRRARQRGLRNRWAFDDPADEDAAKLRGFGAELAIARLIRVTWRPNFLIRKRDLDRPDVDGGYEVRHSSRLTGPLYLKPGNEPRRRYVLATGSPPVIRIVGWIAGADGMQSRYWREDLQPPAWVVPQDDLTPWPPKGAPAGEPRWDADDPDRPCFTCGATPTGTYRDGSPSYTCGPHEPTKSPEPLYLTAARAA